MTKVKERVLLFNGKTLYTLSIGRSNDGVVWVELADSGYSWSLFVDLEGGQALVFFKDTAIHMAVKADIDDALDRIEEIVNDCVVIAEKEEREEG